MGAPALSNPAAVTVSSSPIIVAAANPKRLGIIITQTSANAVRVGASDVTAAKGMRLGQNGELRLGVLAGCDECPTEAIYAIREGGVDGTVVVLEYAGT